MDVLFVVPRVVTYVSTVRFQSLSQDVRGCGEDCGLYRRFHNAHYSEEPRLRLGFILEVDGIMNIVYYARIEQFLRNKRSENSRTTGLRRSFVLRLAEAGLFVYSCKAQQGQVRNHYEQQSKRHT